MRELLIRCSEHLISSINNNIDLKRYLRNYPFSIDQVDIHLYLVDAEGRGLDDPYIGIASLSQGQLIYKTIVRIDGIPSFKSSESGSYEEAVLLLHENRRE